MMGRIVQLSRSGGGVPKLPVPEAQVTRLGLEGDVQRNRRFHGGPRRALCLYALERIEQLQEEGHPIQPGSTGENVTLQGLDWAMLKPGDRLMLGDEVEIQITSYVAPCKNIGESFRGGEFTRISQKLHPGDARLYARVLREGHVAAGQQVQVLSS